MRDYIKIRDCKKGGVNVSKILKRKYAKDRASFRCELYEVMKEDLTLAMFIQQIYISYNDRRLLWKSFEILGFNHKEAYRSICDANIPLRMMSGRYDEIFNNLYFVQRDIYDKYNRKIPERYALGDAYGVALRVFKEQSK